MISDISIESDCIGHGWQECDGSKGVTSCCAWNEEDFMTACVHSSVQRWHFKTWSCGQQSVGTL